MTNEPCQLGARVQIVRPGVSHTPCVGRIGIVERADEDGWFAVRFPPLEGFDGQPVPFCVRYRPSEIVPY